MKSMSVCVVLFLSPETWPWLSWESFSIKHKDKLEHRWHNLLATEVIYSIYNLIFLIYCDLWLFVFNEDLATVFHAWVTAVLSSWHWIGKAFRNSTCARQNNPNLLGAYQVLFSILLYRPSKIKTLLIQQPVLHLTLGKQLLSKEVQGLQYFTGKLSVAEIRLFLAECPVLC